MAEYKFRIVFAGLMVFKPVSDPNGMWVLLVDTSESPSPRRGHFPHRPEIRWNCQEHTGEKCERGELKQEDLRIEGLLAGSVARDLGGVYSLTKHLKLEPVQARYVRQLPNKELLDRVVARVWLSGGKVRAVNPTPCCWSLGPARRPPRHFSWNLARHIVFDANGTFCDPVIIRRYNHETNKEVCPPFRIPADFGGNIVAWIVNQPCLNDWNEHLGVLRRLPHFALYHRVTGDRLKPDALVPHNPRRNLECMSESAVDEELLGTGPIICPSVQDND